MRPRSRSCRRIALTLLASSLGMLAPALAEDLPEYRLKAAFLFHFAQFTDWPATVGGTLNLCIAGQDPFGKEIDVLQAKRVGDRTVAVLRKAGGDALGGCQIVFVAPSAISTLPRVLDSVRGQTVLVVADSPDAARQGAALNMSVAQNKVSFEANLVAARGAGLNLSSKLLRLAKEVIQ